MYQPSDGCRSYATVLQEIHPPFGTAKWIAAGPNITSSLRRAKCDIACLCLLRQSACPGPRFSLHHDIQRQGNFHSAGDALTKLLDHTEFPNLHRESAARKVAYWSIWRGQINSSHRSLKSNGSLITSRLKAAASRRGIRACASFQCEAPVVSQRKELSKQNL